MEHFKQKDAHFTAKQHRSEFVAQIMTAQAVTVSETKPLSFNISDKIRLLHYLKPYLCLQIVGSPIIMIPLKKIDLHTPVTQYRQFTQNTHETTGYYIFVFDPKIKNISKQI